MFYILKSPLGEKIISNHGKIKLTLFNSEIKSIVVDKITKEENILIGFPTLLQLQFSLICVNNICRVSLNGIQREVFKNNTKIILFFKNQFKNKLLMLEQKIWLF